MSYSQYTFAVTFADGATLTYSRGGRSLTDAMWSLLDALLNEEGDIYGDLKHGGDVVKVEYVPPNILTERIAQKSTNPH